MAPGTYTIHCCPARGYGILLTWIGDEGGGGRSIVAPRQRGDEGPRHRPPPERAALCLVRRGGRTDSVMPRIIFAILLLLMALIQTTILPMGHVIGLTPDLVLVCLLLWSATR